MKNLLTLSVFALLLSATTLMAQQPDIQYFRPWNKAGINVFEPAKKAPQPEFTGIKVRIGGAFTQDFQSLKSENKPTYVATSATNATNNYFLSGVVANVDST
jgi:hypothetical protein